MKDYYEILGVSKEASHEEIRKAYKILAKKYHPDISKEENAQEKFQEITESYEILSNPEKRANYDQYGNSGMNFNNQYSNYQSNYSYSDFKGASNFKAFSFTDFYQSKTFWQKLLIICAIILFSVVIIAVIVIGAIIWLIYQIFAGIIRALEGPGR